MFRDRPAPQLVRTHAPPSAQPARNPGTSRRGRTSFAGPVQRKPGRSLRIATRLAAYASLAAFVVSASPATAQESGILWTSRTEYPFAPSPVAADVDLDRSDEIFLIAGNGSRAALVDPASGDPLWEREAPFSGQLLFEPVPGWFTPDGGIDLALVTSDAGGSELLVLDGRTGRGLVSYLLDEAPAAPPAAVPFSEWTSGGGRPADPGEGIALVDKKSRLTIWRIGSDATPVIHARHRLRGFSENPPMVVRTRAPLPLPHVAALSESGWITIVSASDPTAAPMHFKVDGSFLRTFLSAGDVDGDGYDDLLVAGDRGWLRAFQVGGQADRPQLTEAWPRVSIRQEPSTAPAVGDFNGDGRDDVLIVKDSRFFAVNGATGAIDLWPQRELGSHHEYIHDVAVSSPPSIVFGEDGRGYALFGDIAGRFNLLDLRTGGSAGGNAVLQTGVEGDLTTRNAIVAGPLTGAGAISFLAVGARTGVPSFGRFAVPADPDREAWRNAFGNSWRTNGYSRRHAMFREMRAAALMDDARARVATAQAHYAAGEWDESIAAATGALELAPRFSEAREMAERAENRKNLPWTILKTLALLAVFGTGAWFGWKAYRKNARVRGARSAAARGDYRTAIALMRQAVDESPNRTEYQRELADYYIAGGRVADEAIPALQAVHRLDPANAAYVQALAAAYASAGRRDEEAGRVFLEMSRLAPDQGVWLFHLAEVYEAQGANEQAAEALEEALRKGYGVPETREMLADLYVILGRTGGEAAAVLKAALGRRFGDDPYLQAFCRAALAAGEMDSEALRAAEELEKRGAANAEARVILAEAALRSGDEAGACGLAEAALAELPDQLDAVRIVAKCRARAGASDERAREVYEKALSAGSDDPEIAAALAAAWANEGRTDPEAEAIYLRVVENAPGSLEIFRRLAEIADARQDDELALRALRPVWDSGDRETDLVLQYARALIAKGITEPPAEEVLQEAVDLEPGDQRLSAALAEIFAANGRQDQDAVGIYEETFRNGGGSAQVARQLLKSYEAARRHDLMLEFAEQARGRFPQDPAINQALARARMGLGQTEEAMAAFEQVFDAHPDDKEAVLGLAGFYLDRQKMDDRALEVYRRAVALDPQNIEFSGALARCWIARDRWDEAVKTVRHFLAGAPKRMPEAINLMRDLVEPKPEALDLHWFLVDTSIFAGKIQNALKQLETILSIDTNQANRALETMDKMLDRQPDNALIHHYRGRLLLKLNRVREGRNSLEQAYRLDQSSETLARDLLGLYGKLAETSETPELRYQMGNVALRVGNYDLAISCFQQTERDPRFEIESIQNLARCFISKGMLDLALKELTRVPMDKKTKEALYNLGQRFEKENNLRGAQDAYKAIYAADIAYNDVKVRLEALQKISAEADQAERAAIAEGLSEKAKKRYELQGELGRGAMGIVYKARDIELDEVVALKILPESLEKNENALRLFRQEARNARKLAHRNIVRIHDIGEEQGRKYISMEYVSGIDLKRRLKQVQGPLELRETLHYGRQIARAMMAAHEVGIVHRDLKPANIMITRRGRIKVTDFGIAKMIEDEKSLYRTKPGAVVGTPLYMSPEQVRGQDVDYRADIYSFGIIMYEMLTGRPPFIEGNLARHHLYTQPAPFEENVPEAVGAIVMKCLAKEPDQRWENFREILKELSVLELTDAGADEDADGEDENEPDRESEPGAAEKPLSSN